MMPTWYSRPEAQCGALIVVETIANWLCLAWIYAFFLLAIARNIQRCS
jgi:hypothetical protein